MAASGNRQRKFVDQRLASVGRAVGHFKMPCAAGIKAMQRSESLAKQAEIGRRITDPEHPLALRIRPACMDAPIDQPPRDDAEALRIEIAEVDDIDHHKLM